MREAIPPGALHQLVDLCARWGHDSPRAALESGAPQDALSLVLRWLPTPPYSRALLLGFEPGDLPSRWRKVGDTGIGDTTAHATPILAQFGFEQMLEHEFRTASQPSGSALSLLFLHPRGVLAQIQGTRPRNHDDQWTVADFRFWGCARNANTPALEAIRATGNTIDNDETALRIQVSRDSRSFGLAWLTTQALGLKWITPWPVPAVSSWLGPDSPALGEGIERNRVAGEQNTRTLLARLPDQVRARLGIIIQLAGADGRAGER